MTYLRKAVDLEQERLLEKGTSNNNPSSYVAIQSSLLRLLAAPRDEMGRNKDGLTARNIMRQYLGANS